MPHALAAHVDSNKVSASTLSFMKTARRAILAVMIFAIPLEHALLLADVQPEVLDPYRRWALLLIPLDLLWIGFVVLAAPMVWRAWTSRKPSWGVVATTVTFVAMAIAYVVNPSVLGLTLIARAAGSIAVVAVVVQFNRAEFRTFVAAPLLATASLQSVLALGQVLVRPVGGIERGPWTSGQGTLYHPYILAGILLVALAVSIAVIERDRWRPLWLVGVGITTVGISTTFSRAAALSLAFIVTAYIWGSIRNRDRYLGPLLASVIPGAISGVYLWRGWSSALGRTVGSGGLDRASSGRLTLMRQSLTMIADSPVVGVGPGGYLPVLADARPDLLGSHALAVVHSVPMALGAEAGIAIGFLYLVFLAVLGVRALRTSPAAAAVFVSLIVFIIFDKFTYSNANMILLAAVWLASLDFLARPSDEHATVSSTDTPAR